MPKGTKMKNDLQLPDDESEGRLVWMDSPSVECPDCAKAEAERKARGGYLAALKLLLAISGKPKTDDRNNTDGGEG